MGWYTLRLKFLNKAPAKLVHFLVVIYKLPMVGCDLCPIQALLSDSLARMGPTCPPLLSLMWAALRHVKGLVAHGGPSTPSVAQGNA